MDNHFTDYQESISNALGTSPAEVYSFADSSEKELLAKLLDAAEKVSQAHEFMGHVISQIQDLPYKDAQKALKHFQKAKESIEKADEALFSNLRKNKEQAQKAPVQAEPKEVPPVEEI